MSINVTSSLVFCLSAFEGETPSRDNENNIALRDGVSASKVFKQKTLRILVKLSLLLVSFNHRFLSNH